MIQLKNVTKVYKPKKGNDVNALNDISLDLPNKGLIFLVGKSGSGKSTLLNIIGGLDKPTSGEVIVNGNSIYNYDEKYLTNYRANKVGFVFQNYNLLEELNVYENIAISSNNKDNKNLVLEYLTKVGLEGFSNRKINELSGGEKQRIAIARALIKNPNIILADEPTGNLDSINSEQIFNILKDISKECLVVVVTHDNESALKFGDSIIEISDGKLISNGLKENFEDLILSEKYSQPKLKFINKFYLALGMIKRKKVKVFITALLVTFSFTILATSFSLLNFDIHKTHADTMIHENDSEIIINKKSDSGLLSSSLFPNDLNQITNKISSKYSINSHLYSNNAINMFSFSYNPKTEDLQTTAYYEVFNNSFETIFITKSEEELENLDILGSIPTQANEVLISELFANYLVIYGFKTYQNETVQLPSIYDTTVNNINELLNKKIYLDNDYVIIKGIIKDNSLKEYDSLKNISFNEAEFNKNELYQKYISNYKNTFNFYINENFFKVSKLKENNNIEGELYKINYTYNKQDYYEMYFTGIIKDEIEYFNGKEILKTNNLKDNEIIISSMLLDEILDYQVSKQTREEVVKAKEEYDRKVKEREENLKEIEQNLLIDPDYEYEEIPEIEPVDSNKIIKDITNKLFVEYNVLNSNIILNIRDNYNINHDGVKNYEFKIIGYSNDLNSLISNNYNYYSMPNELTSSIVINEENKESLVKLFNDFANSDYNLTTKYSEKINTMQSIVIRLEHIFKYVNIGLLLFTIVLFSLFILSSINNNKRKVGILKAIGVKSSDIILIFIIETLIIGLLAFILANVLNILVINALNNYITKEIIFYCKPILYNRYTVIYVLGIIILLILVTFIIPIKKLIKSKPVDLIN